MPMLHFWDFVKSGRKRRYKASGFYVVEVMVVVRRLISTATTMAAKVTGQTAHANSPIDLGIKPLMPFDFCSINVMAAANTVMKM